MRVALIILLLCALALTIIQCCQQRIIENLDGFRCKEAAYLYLAGGPSPEICGVMIYDR